MFITVKQAAAATGKSKPTILRAIQAHRISATKDETTGAWIIDPAELHRVYPPASEADTQRARADASAFDDLAVLRHELAMKDEQLGSLRQERERERSNARETIDDLREDRNRWRIQAERLLLARPVTPEITGIAEPAASPPATAKVPAAAQETRRSWWHFGKR